MIKENISPKNKKKKQNRRNLKHTHKSKQETVEQWAESFSSTLTAPTSTCVPIANAIFHCTMKSFPPTSMADRGRHTCSIGRMFCIIFIAQHSIDMIIYTHTHTYMLFSVNVVTGPSEERSLITGIHVVRDIYCTNCHIILGWKYVCVFSVIE